MKSLWSGRFEKGMDDLVAEFNSSILYDVNLYKYDIKGSIAHVTMLETIKLVSLEERDAIIDGLKEIEERIENGDLKFTFRDEDIHMAIETELIKNIGDVGRKLHTGRSRNDQVNVDTRMYLKDEIEEIIYLLGSFLEVILEKAEANTEKIMPGFTHLQHAQPISIGFHMMAYFQQFKRDIERLEDTKKRVDYNPLGAGALAGTTLPIDRHLTTKLLGFKDVSENAMDTVADRDYIVEFLSAASICMAHLSRFSEEFIIWNSQEFSFINIDDSFCTGSSIMPQKKNPDMPELIRGKAGGVYGSLMAMLTTIKGLPMAYNKDFQEDKKALFDTVKTLKYSLQIFSNMLKNSSFNYKKIEKHMERGFLTATDVAEFLVLEGIPFRTSHEIVGKMVKYCEDKDISLEDLKEEDLSKIDKSLEGIKLLDLDNLSSLKRRDSFGGTSPRDVKRQIENGKEFLNNIRHCD